MPAADEFVYTGKMRIHPQLADRLVDIDSVQPHPENYNNGDEDLIEESILENGLVDDILVQSSTGYIIHGNNTWAVCKSLGAEVIPASYRDVDDTEARKIMVAMNLTAAKAKRDQGLLIAMMDKIEANEGDLVGTGLTREEVDVMRALDERPLDFEGDPYEGWPTFSVQVPPHVLAEFMTLTESDEAETNRDRFELLLKMAKGTA